MASRNNLSPIGRATARERAEAAALAQVEYETRLRREKSARLRKARLEQEKNDK